MDKFQKSLILWSLTALAVILGIFMAVSIYQKLNTALTANTISFNGEGKVTSKPDIATVEFSILTEASTSKAAQDDNSGKSQKTTDFLKKQGIAGKDIKTTSYNIYPQYYYPRPIVYRSESSTLLPPVRAEQPKIVGYQVSQGFQIKIRNFDMLSGIIDGLISVGVNNVNNLGFSIDNLEQLKTEARAQAIADAKKKAGELKSQLGIRLGKIVNFSENAGAYPGPIAYEAKGLGGSVTAGPSLPPGENKITVDVILTYQIK